VKAVQRDGLGLRAPRALRGARLPIALLLLFGLFSAQLNAADGFSNDGVSSDGLANNGASRWLAEQDVQFLKVDEAFQFEAEQGPDGAVLARWQMPDGYYLYRHAFQFEVRGLSGSDGSSFEIDTVALGGAEIPPGKAKVDEYFGDVEVYYHQAQARLPVAASDSAGFARTTGFEVGITYQGCADAGLCYPPETKWVPVSFASGSGVPPAATTTAINAATGAVTAGVTAASATEPATEEQRLAAELASSGVLFSLGLFLLGGIALAFTPCVLPMVPILSSIIVGESAGDEKTPAFRLSLAYVLGMAITYAILGVLVGLFGAQLNLQASLQSAPVLVFFAAVFVALSFSMFGFYELQLPQKLQNALNDVSANRAGGRYLSVFVMGAVSSLVVSPCVSAPLAGALIYISTTGDALFGGAALLALGLGMGVPLLIIGASSGHLLPKAGVWMDNVKAVFGVLLLGVAVWLLERVVPAGVTLALWSALAIGVGVYLGALDFSPRTGWGQLWKASGALSLTYGVLLLIGAASGAEDPLQPLQRVGGSVAVASVGAAGTPGVPTHGGDWITVKGLAEFEAERQRGQAAGKPVFLDLYADWCISCKVMERRVFPAPQVNAQLAEFHLIRADVTKHNEQDKALMEKYGLFGPPSMVFFADDGNQIVGLTVQGELDTAAMARHLGRVLEVTADVTSSNVALNSGI